MTPKTSKRRKSIPGQLRRLDPTHRPTRKEKALKRKEARVVHAFFNPELAQLTDEELVNLAKDEDVDGFASGSYHSIYTE